MSPSLWIPLDQVKSGLIRTHDLLWCHWPSFCSLGNCSLNDKLFSWEINLTVVKSMFLSFTSHFVCRNVLFVSIKLWVLLYQRLKKSQIRIIQNFFLTAFFLQDNGSARSCQVLIMHLTVPNPLLAISANLFWWFLCLTQTNTTTTGCFLTWLLERMWNYLPAAVSSTYLSLSYFSKVRILFLCFVLFSSGRPFFMDQTVHAPMIATQSASLTVGQCIGVGYNIYLMHILLTWNLLQSLFCFFLLTFLITSLLHCLFVFIYFLFIFILFLFCFLPSC